MSKGTGTVTLRGVLRVEFDYYSTPYIPERRYLSNGDPGYPAEGGEFEIEGVYYEGEDIIDLLSDKALEEIEEEYCKQDHSDY